MRTKMVTVAGAFVAAGWLFFGGLVSAQSENLIVRIGFNSTFSYTFDGSIGVSTGQHAPVIDAVGTTVGTANFIRVEEGPALAYLPTVFEVSALGASYVLNEIRSQDDTLRRTFGFRVGPSGPTGFFDAAVIAVPGSDGRLTGFVVKASPLNLAPTDASIDHAFYNTQAISQATVGGTILSSRSNSRWDLIPGPGQSVPVGENFNISAANSAQAFVVNFLRMPDLQSGAVVTCIAPTVCGFAGTGSFQGLFGSAESRSPAVFGIPSNAASTTSVTSLATGIAAPEFGCPDGQPLPPPRGLLATQVGQDLTLRWDSVACAKSYEVRARFSDGSTFDINVGETTQISRAVESVVAFAVASVGEDDVQVHFLHSSQSSAFPAPSP